MAHIDYIDFLTTDKNDKDKLCILNEQSYSLTGVDLFVCLKLKYKQNGYFVEFGAGDGIKASNTYLLEQNFNWKGLVAEPAKGFHNSLVTNRKNCIVDFGCVGPVTGEKVYFLEEQEGKRMYSHVLGYPGSKSFVYSNKYILETVSLNDLLNRNNCPKVIDFLSMDMKGGELETLQKYDFKERTILIFCVDYSYQHIKDQSNTVFIKRLMLENGYNFFRSETSEGWFVHKDIDKYIE